MKTLSDKRRELFKKICNNKTSAEITKLASIFVRITEQDKQFIKDLKDNIEDFNLNIPEDWRDKKRINTISLYTLIDKLAGNKLIEEKEE